MYRYMSTYIYMYTDTDSCIYAYIIYQIPHVSVCVFALSRWTTTPPLTRTPLATPQWVMRTPRCFMYPCIAEWLLIMQQRMVAKKPLSGPGNDFFLAVVAGVMDIIFDIIFGSYGSFLVGTPVSVYQRAITPTAEAAAREANKPRGGL